MNSEKFSSLIFESKCANIPNSKNTPGDKICQYVQVVY